MTTTSTELSGRRIAIIGGAGFVGHSMAICLKELGAEVTVFDSLTVNNYFSLLGEMQRGASWNLSMSFIMKRFELLKERGVSLIKVDSRDYDLLSEHLGNFSPDTIVHLAAVSNAGNANKDPRSAFENSLLTLENSLEYTRRPEARIRNFIYFSSSMVYGDFPTGGVTETTPCNPIGIYGSLKYAAEQMVKAYGQVFDLPFTIIRPSALYGRGCISRRVGQLFIEKALAGERVTVHGDGSDRLDFTYIDDLIEGISCVLLTDASIGEIFNMTYGESRSLADLVTLLRCDFPNIDVEFLPKDNLVPDRGTLDVTKAKLMLGYSPEFPLERGFPKYVAWYRDVYVHNIARKTNLTADTEPLDEELVSDWV